MTLPFRLDRWCSRGFAFAKKGYMVYRFSDGVSYHLALREHMACWPNGLTYDAAVHTASLRDRLVKRA